MKEDGFRKPAFERQLSLFSEFSLSPRQREERGGEEKKKKKAKRKTHTDKRSMKM